MNYMKKTARLFISAVTLAAFTACSSPAKEQEPTAAPEQVQETAQPSPSETPAQTPEPTPTPTPIPTKTPEPEAHGPFTDPAAFAGFDTYTAGGQQVVLGTTTYGDVSSQYINIQKVSQLADKTHESVKDPEVFQAGAYGRIITNYYGKTGGQLAYLLYNPTDEDAAFEECVIVGVQDQEGMVFSNGIDFWNVTPKQLIEILGEPYEIKGTVSDKLTDARFIWRDESNDHQLTLSYYDDGQVNDVNGMTYTNLSAGH
ncbi:MAG: hypothetical protein IIZ57_02535 [Solobacterium sp.]|nr:hypothetical protein [Solobacterium sp.]